MKFLIPITLSLLLSLSTAYSQESNFETTKLLAEQGDTDAQANLGFMYMIGLGVPENDAEAVKWIRLAAEQGFAEAQYNLGFMYANGKDVLVNYMAAYVWYSVAAAQGYEDARTGRDMTADRLTTEQRARGQEMATRCIESVYKDCD